MTTALWAGALAALLGVLATIFGLHARRLARELGKADAERNALRESLIQSARLLQRARRARPTRDELRAAVARMSEDADDG